MKYPFSFLIIIGIWVVCMIPVPETPLSSYSFADKWTHFLMYAILSATIWTEYALRHKKGEVSRLRLAVGAVLLPMIMGGLVELAQANLTTYRSGDWFDALCNSLGVVIGSIIGCFIFRYIITKRK